jgi:hypothetical protein
LCSVRSRQYGRRHGEGTETTDTGVQTAAITMGLNALMEKKKEENSQTYDLPTSWHNFIVEHCMKERKHE